MDEWFFRIACAFVAGLIAGLIAGRYWAFLQFNRMLDERGYPRPQGGE